jgi:primase-polymerase (primpol)-like protein
MAFKDGVDRLPVDAGTLHADVGTALREQPVTQLEQVARHGAEGPNLFEGLAPGLAREQAGNDCGFVDVESTRAFDNHVHGTPPWSRRPLRRREAKNLPYVLPTRGATKSGP